MYLKKTDIKYIKNKYSAFTSEWRHSLTLLFKKYFAFFSAPASHALLERIPTHRAYSILPKAHEKKRKVQTKGRKMLIFAQIIRWWSRSKTLSIISEPTATDASSRKTKKPSTVGTAESFLFADFEPKTTLKATTKKTSDLSVRISLVNLSTMRRYRSKRSSLVKSVHAAKTIMTARLEQS